MKNISSCAATLAVLATFAAQAYGQPKTVIATPLVSGPGTGNLAGTVVDEAGKGLADVIVSVTRDLPVVPRGQKPEPFVAFRSLAVTARDGTFSAGSLPAGLFKVCAQVPKSDYLEECQWPITSNTVTLSEGQSAKLPTIRVKKGFRLKIRVEDPIGILPRSVAAAQSTGLSVVVFGDRRLFVHAHRVATDKAGFDYEVLVPFDMPLHFSATSPVLTLSDGAGKAADLVHGIVTALTVPSGTAAMVPVQVMVTGTKR